MNNDTVTISRAEYEGLLKANEELTKQVEILTQQIALARKQRYGSSSEQSKYDDGSEQLSFLFNEPEVYADSSVVPHLLRLRSTSGSASMSRGNAIFRKTLMLRTISGIFLNLKSSAKYAANRWSGLARTKSAV